MRLCTSPDCTSQMDRNKLVVIALVLITFVTWGWDKLPTFEEPIVKEDYVHRFQPLTYTEHQRIMESNTVKLVTEYSLKDTCYYWPYSDPEKCDPIARKPRQVEGSLKP